LLKRNQERSIVWLSVRLKMGFMERLPLNDPARVLAEGKFASEQHIGEAPLPLPLDIDLDQLERAYSLMM
ncbi:hypothetical protein ACQYY4_33300, partial [Pseudomonas aeruginosa]